MKRYFLVITTSTAVCWAVFVFLLTQVAPQDAGVAGVLFFYLTLFCAVAGSLTLLGYGLRRRITKTRVVLAHLQPAFRQGLLLAGLLVVALVLQSMRLLSGWNGALLIVAVVLLELFFQSRKGVPSTTQRA